MKSSDRPSLQCDDPGEGSVTGAIRAMQTGDDKGADFLWSRFSTRLEELVRSRLHPTQRHVADEEDVVLESLTELFRGLLNGKFTEVSNRSEFWRLLVTVASRNVIDQVNRENRQKRGGGRVQNEAEIARSNGNHQGSFLDQVPSTLPTPEIQAMITERCTYLLESLSNNELRTIAVARAAGSTNQEVAENLGVSLRSVERRLAEIRNQWSRMD